MPIKIKPDLDLRKFDAAVTKAAQRQMAQEVKAFKIGASLRAAPFVQTGTLRASYTIGPLARFAQSCEQATRATESSTAVYGMLGRVVDDFARAMAELEPLLWRIQRPWAMLRWGGALTLAIAGAAIWGG
jgi:hypothetical protein